jgi:hypothetical protein
LRINGDKFIRWVQENNKLIERFDNILEITTGFLLNGVLNEYDKARKIAERFESVLKDCDTITYDEEGDAEAYIILHFLDRYHRFQMIYMKLIEMKVFPISEIVKALDVGTGPAPALFALSDIYTLITEYARHEGIKDLSVLKLKTDYVEQSYSFRDWLHHFTEYTYSYKEKLGYSYAVPFHHGTFFDFKDIELDKQFDTVTINGLTTYYPKKRIERHRYNLTIFSNFLTTEQTVENFSKELNTIGRYLKNRGIILVVGATSKSPKYQNVYPRLDGLLDKRNFSNYLYSSEVRKIRTSNTSMSYSYLDNYGGKLKLFFKEILSKFRELGVFDEPGSYAENVLTKVVEPDYSYEPNWEIHIYKKFSRLKKRFRKRYSDVYNHIANEQPVNR